MRLPLVLVIFLSLVAARAAEPFEIREGDRVLFLGDTLLERENTYGYLETRMHEQFPDRHFTVRNLSWAGETPRGWSRASFDSPDKGWERLKEDIAKVRPTVVFLGFGMAASLQEMTDRSGDITLNPDPVRYGAEPMSAPRFKRELGELMDAIVVQAATGEASAAARISAVPQPQGLKEISPGQRPGSLHKSGARPEGAPESPAPAGANASGEAKPRVSPGANVPQPSALKGDPATAVAGGGGVRFVLLSPIRHEDLRAVKPGLTDPAEHNQLLEQYAKAIEELGQERGGRFVSLMDLDQFSINSLPDVGRIDTDNGIHLTERGYRLSSMHILKQLGLDPLIEKGSLDLAEIRKDGDRWDALRAAVIRKNDLFFHQFRPANSTYLFGFRKHEQGQNAKEMPMYDPLIEAAEAEIDRLKKAVPAPGAATGTPEVIPVSQGVASKTESRAAKPESTAEKPESIAAKPESIAAKPESIAANPESIATNPQSIASKSEGTPFGTAKAAVRSENTPVLQPLPDFTVEDGYQIELWAQNPYLEKPTQMNWDPQGRLWVCSSSLYPMVEPGQAVDDKILILEDPDHSGKATKSTVFADGLLIPSGVVPDIYTAEAQRRGGKEENAAADPSSSASPRLSASAVQFGCYVGQSTELLYLSDPNGTGHATEKRIVFSGFGTEDTHHIVHTLHWGPDGRLYFHQSVYIHTHLETPWGMVRLNSGGVFAYDPRTERVEVFIKGLWNTWGQAEDDWGQSFFTDGAGSTGLTWGFPGAIFAPFEGSRRQMASISPGSYPKFAGLEIVKSPAFPAEWQGNAVTCDFRAHRIVRFAIEDLAIGPMSPIGHMGPIPRSGYTTTEQPDLVRTTDLSFRPIDVKMGPDGALYVADWSNPVINHGEVDFRDPRRDHHMGRIWRITKKGAPALKWEPLLGKKNEELLDKLLSKSAWEKEQARFVLRQSINPGAEGKNLSDILRGKTCEKGPDGPFNYDAMLQGAFLNLPDTIGISGCNDPRFAAIGNRMLASAVANIWRFPGSDPQDMEQARFLYSWIATATKIDQPSEGVDSPRVRLEAMRGLARIPTSQSAGLVLDAALKTPENDPHYDFAAWLSINDLAKPWTDAIASGAWKTEGHEAQLAYGLKSIDPTLASATLSRLFAAGKVPVDGSGPWIELIGDAGGPAELQRLLDGLLAGFVGDCCESDATRAIDPKLALSNAEVGMRNAESKSASGAAAGSAIPNSEFQNPHSSPAERAILALQTAARVRGARPAAHSELVIALFHSSETITSGAIRLAGLWHAPEAVARIGELLDSRETKPPLRRAAVDGLRAAGGAPALGFLNVLTRPEEATDTRAAALVAITQMKLDAGVVKAAEILPTLPDAALLGTWRGLLGVKGAPEAFAVKFGQQGALKAMPAPVIVAAQRAAQELGRPGAKLLAALAPAGGAAAGAPSTDYTGLAAQTVQNGDPAKGELVYRRATSACTTCHSIGGAGGKVGPDMTSIGASAPLDYLIESILNPNAKVKEGFNAVTLALADGTTATGIQARETASEVILRDAAGKETGIPKAAIKSKTDIGSMMPAGLTATMQPREAIDLYAFLSQLGKPGAYDASKGKVARVWRMYPGTAAGEVVSATYDPAKNPGFPGYTLVDGRFVKDLLTEATMIASGGADTVLLATQFQSSGKTHLTLTGAEKAWLDGTALVLGGELAPELTNGTHTLVVKIGVKELPPVLRASSEDARFLGN